MNKLFISSNNQSIDTEARNIKPTCTNIKKSFVERIPIAKSNQLGYASCP